MLVAESPTQALLAFAREHNILVSEEDIRAIKNAASDSKLSRWAQANIPTEAGTVITLSQISGDGGRAPAIIPVAADQFDATRRLKDSTSSIHAQTQKLRRQINALNTFRSADDHHASEEEHARHLALRAQSLSFANQDALTETNSTLNTEIDQLQKNFRLNFGSLTQSLNTHDRLLDHIQKQPDPNGSTSRWIAEQSLQIEQLEQVLIRLRTECIKSRLDRVYLESLNDSLPASNGESKLASTHMEELSKDIRSLYTEISDVVSMVVAQQHAGELRLRMDEMSTSQSNAEQRALQKKILALNRMTETLTHLEDEMNKSWTTQTIDLRMLEHLHAIKQQQELQSKLVQPSQSDGRHDQLSFLSSPRHRPETSHVVSTRDQNISTVLSDELQAFSNTLLDAAAGRREALQVFAKCSQESLMAEDHLNELEQNIAEARHELEQVQLR